MTTLTTAATLVATASLADWMKALKVAGAAIPTRVPVPVLSGVLIESKHHRTTVTGFNYELAGVATVGGAIAPNDVRVLVHHKTLANILVGIGKRATKRVSDAWNVSLTVDGAKVSVQCQGSSFDVATMPIEEFPNLPKLDAEHAYGVNAAQFIRRMDSAMVSVSTDDTLPILTGIRMECTDGTLSLLTTDRYRLTLADMPIYGHPVPDNSFLLTSKGWKQFKKVLNAKGSDITLQFEDRWISFEQDGVKVAAIAIDGEYPKIRSLFPDSTPVQFEMDADLLAAAVQSVSVVAERNTPVRFTYNGIDSLRVDAGTGEDATGQAFLPYNSPAGNRGYTVCFNPTYLLSVLKDVKGDVVRFQHHDSNGRPAMVVGAGTEHTKHLVMPVRLPNK